MTSARTATGEVAGMTSHWVADDPGRTGLSQAFDRVSKCLAIVTAQGADGSLVGACCSVLPKLLDTAPSALAWTLSHDAPGLPVFTHATHVALNFFTVQDVDADAVERLFAGQGNDKFSALAFEFGLGGAPLLERAVATFECENQPQGKANSQGLRQFVGVVRRYRQAYSQTIASGVTHAPASYASPPPS